MELANLTWPKVDALSRDTPVVIPVAALEQHGHHMPLFTDSLLMGEIARRAHQELNRHILLTPLMWLGNSHHHMDFPGTVSADPRLWIDLLGGLVDNFITHGFKRIVVLNGHGGNDVPGQQAMFEIRQRYRQRSDLLLLFATYWNLADPESQLANLAQSKMGHACEWETSMILRLSPGLVHDHEQAPEVRPDEEFLPASRAWTIPDVSKLGHIGVPAAASAEKGEQLFELFTAGVVELMQRVIDWNGNAENGQEQNQ